MSRTLKKSLPYGVASILLILFIAPLYILLTNSFKSNAEIIDNPLALPQNFSFDYILNAIEQVNYFNALFISIIVTTLSVGLILVISSIAAWALVRNKTKISHFLFLAFASALLIPFQSVMYPLISLFDSVGMKNLFGLIIMYGGFGVAMSIFLYHGFIKNIPLSLEEAAYIDGASTFQVYRHVLLPLIKPITVTIAILNVMWIWNDFLLPNLVVGTSGPRTLPLELYYAKILSGQYGNPWELIYPSVLISIIPAIIFFFILQKYIVEGITQGSVK